MKKGLFLFILSLILGLGGLFGSYLLFQTLQNIDRNYQQSQLNSQCQSEINLLLARWDSAVALAQSVNEMNNFLNRTLNQTEFGIYMTNSRKNTRIPVDMLQIDLIDTTAELAEWIDKNPNITISGINQQTFRKEPIVLDNPEYLLVTTCNPCPLSIGIDYYSESKRREVATRGELKRIPTVSHPLRTSITSSFGRSALVLSIFIPRFHPVTNEFLGGIGTSYSNTTLFPRQDLEHKFVIFGDEVFIETPNFAATDLKYSNTTKVLDQDATLSCGTFYNQSIVAWLVMGFAAIVSILVPLIVGISYFLRRKQSRTFATLMTQEQNLRDAIVREQAADETNKLKSAFLASMSHEIRTPINGITGLIDFLLDTKLDPTQLDYAQTIKYSAFTLLAIINDILDFSKIEAGKLEIDPTNFDMAELVRTVAKASEPLMVKNSNMLSSEILIPTPLYVKSDSNRIRQILNNLLSNAAKFTVRGNIVLRCTLDDTPATLKENDGESRIYIHLSVQDSGIGMTPTQVKNLFKPFTQADASTARLYGGTGLGLSISMSLSTALGGDIKVTSKEGEGSTFTVSIPYVPGEPVKETTGEDVIMRGKGLVLIAEDNPVNLTVALKSVKDLGYDVAIAKDGVEALEKVAELGDKIDIILMDGQMPRLDGYEASVELRRRGFKKPIVAFTASVTSGEYDHCLASGMNDLIPKPFKKTELSRKLYRYVLGEGKDIANVENVINVPLSEIKIE